MSIPIFYPNFRLANDGSTATSFPSSIVYSNKVRGNDSSGRIRP